MNSYDNHLATSLDLLAEKAQEASAIVVLRAAADRLRAFAQISAHLRPPPPIVPTPLPPMPATEHILDTVDDVQTFHDVGQMPAHNAKLKRPREAEAEPLPARTAFEDPRLKPGYKPPKK